jgi:molecular chaperone DnaK (HSP70)
VTPAAALTDIDFAVLRSVIMAPETIMAIDLGASHSRVALWLNGDVTVVRHDDDDAREWVESCVTLPLDDAASLIVGRPSATQPEPQGVVVEMIPRIFGRDPSDPLTRKEVHDRPYDVVEGPDGRAAIQIRDSSRGRSTVALADLVAAILRHLKNAAERTAKMAINKAVIAVPAPYGSLQRLAVQYAASLIGLEIIRVVSTSTMSSLSYGLQKYPAGSVSGACVYAVVDVGAGTTSATLMASDDGVYEVLATSGAAVGGRDLDERLVRHCAARFRARHPGLASSLSGDSDAMRRLRNSCEQAKHVLSTASEAVVEVEWDGGHHDHESISREFFEELCEDIWEAMTCPLRRVLAHAQARMTAEGTTVSEAVVVGGGARIRKLGKVMKAAVKHIRVFTALEVTAVHGTAVMATILGGAKDPVLREVLLIDVAPQSLGVETTGGFMHRLVEANTSIPQRRVQVFATSKNSQGSAQIRVFEGDADTTALNTLIATVHLSDMNLPQGEPQIEVTFSIDANGITSVTAYDKTCRNKTSVTVDVRRPVV